MQSSQTYEPQNVIRPPFAPNYTPHQIKKLEEAATQFGQPFEVQDENHDWVAEEITKTRLLTANVLKDVAQHHYKRRVQAEKPKPAVAVTPVQPPTQDLTFAENRAEQEFFAQPQKDEERAAESRRVREEWTQEENKKYLAYEQKMRNRSFGEKIRSAAGSIWNGISSLLPGAASRKINRNSRKMNEGLKVSLDAQLEAERKELEAQGLDKKEYESQYHQKQQEYASLYESQQLPALEVSMPSRWQRLKEGWSDFTSNFGLGKGLNRELDHLALSGELSQEEYRSLRKQTVLERISLSPVLMTAQQTASGNSNRSARTPDAPGGDSGSNSGNDNDGGDGNGGDTPQKRPRKRWGLVAAVVAGASLLTGVSLYKQYGGDKKSDSSASTAPNPSGSVSTKVHPLMPAPSAVVEESPEEEDAKPPVVDKKEKVVAKPKPAPRVVAPKRAKTVILPKERPIEPKPEKVEEKKPEPPKVAEKKPQSKEQINPLGLYYAELKAEWGRIQDMENRMKFVYGRHVSAKPARSIVSVQHPKEAPYRPATRYVKCRTNCGTDDQAAIVDLLNGARSLLAEGRFQPNDTPGAVAEKIAQGRKNVVAAQAKINEAERLFADEEKAAKRTYVSNRVAYSDLNRSAAREKLAFLDRQLTAQGLPIDGRIVLKINAEQGTYYQKNGPSEYSVKMTATPTVYDLGELREKLMQAEADLELHVSSFTPKRAQSTYKSLRDVNAALDQIIPMAQRGYVAPAPSVVSQKSDVKKQESKTQKDPAIRKAGVHVAPTIKVRPKPSRATLIQPRSEKQPTKKASYTPKKQEKKTSFASRLIQSMKRFASRTA